MAARCALTDRRAAWCTGAPASSHALRPLLLLLLLSAARAALDRPSDGGEAPAGCNVPRETPPELRLFVTDTLAALTNRSFVKVPQIPHSHSPCSLGQFCHSAHSRYWSHKALRCSNSPQSATCPPHPVPCKVTLSGNGAENSAAEDSPFSRLKRIEGRLVTFKKKGDHLQLTLKYQHRDTAVNVPIEQVTLKPSR